MSNPVSASDLYATVTEALRREPGLEEALLSDFRGTLERRFDVQAPADARMARDGEGFRVTLDGKTYALGDPRRATNGELNDSELELVAGGEDKGGPNSGQQAMFSMDPSAVRNGKQSNRQ